MREIERNAAQGHELSREVARTMSEDGLAALRRTGEVMHAIREAVGQAAAAIRGLEARSHEIGGILGVINEVNDQTNLLALNAAILAAQAGEHGKGFAVVAEEIRELSARTAASTKEITALIASVRQETAGAVEAMEGGTLRVEEGVRTVEALGETVRRAAEDSEKASAASRGIAQATAEQYKGIRQITASAQNINEMSQRDRARHPRAVRRQRPDRQGRRGDARPRAPGAQGDGRAGQGDQAHEPRQRGVGAARAAGARGDARGGARGANSSCGPSGRSRRSRTRTRRRSGTSTGWWGRWRRRPKLLRRELDRFKTG